jgi:putative two-component system response regulator
MYALILDDAELNNLLMTEALRHIEGCIPRDFTRPGAALEFVRRHHNEIGIAISDYDMPGMNGVEFVRAARSIPGFEHVPIVIVTGNDQRSVRREALEAGATDFMNKPFDPVEVRVRVGNLLALNKARLDQQERAAWLAREVAAAVAVIEAREREIITTLAKAAEHRDTDTGDHILRVSGIASLIAAGLGWEQERCALIGLASTMHDIGKIGITDAVLLKKGTLDKSERRHMEDHVILGHTILAGSSSDLIRLAAEIALTHHERWDGTGYPGGLAGEQIPISGRIVAVADVFDALISRRPYKRPWPIARARDYLLAKSGIQFDPACIAAFNAKWEEIRQLLPHYAESDVGDAA